MKVIWSTEAAEELRKRYGSGVSAWRLAYDTEGCGCAVNGVPALWAVSAPEPGDIAADSAPFILWHDPRHAVYFDETLRVTYHPLTNSFRLASDAQIYTSRLVLADHRKPSDSLRRR